MTGTIYVGDQTTTTTSTLSGAGPTATTDTTMSMTMPMNMPMPTTTSTAATTPQPSIVGPAAIAVKLSSARGGTQVHGTMKISEAGTGGHAVISVLASNAPLGGHNRRLITLVRLRLVDLRAGAVARSGRR